jgi:hypothetical protein
MFLLQVSLAASIDMKSVCRFRILERIGNRICKVSFSTLQSPLLIEPYHGEVVVYL